MAFWARVEDSILALRADPERLARYFRVAYWISMGVVILGAVIIFRAFYKVGP